MFKWHFQRKLSTPSPAIGIPVTIRPNLDHYITVYGQMNCMYTGFGTYITFNLIGVFLRLQKKNGKIFLFVAVITEVLREPGYLLYSNKMYSLVCFWFYGRQHVELHIGGPCLAALEIIFEQKCIALLLLTVYALKSVKERWLKFCFKKNSLVLLVSRRSVKFIGFINIVLFIH